jgi:TolB-like protein
MSDIFLSYAREDASRTRLFAEALQARGWSVWWDRTIPPGQTFDQVIEKAIDQARCVVVLWSKASIASDWVKTEAAEAAQRHILVPALIDDVKIPFEFRRIHAARLWDWNGDPADEDFGHLLRAISEIIGGESPTPVGEDSAGRDTPQPTPSAPAVAPRARRRGALLGVLAALVAVALGGVAAYRLRPRPPVIVGVMEIRSRGGVPPWMCDFTRDGLNTVLSKLRPLNVYSRQKIDLLQRKRGLTEIEAAEQLGIAKMISGTLVVADHAVVLEIEVVDVGTGMLQDTERVRGVEDQLVELQNKAAAQLVRLLDVPVAEDQLEKIFASRTDDQLESYKLLTESMGGFLDEGDAAPAPAPKGPAKQPEESAKDVEKVAALYVQMNDQMREALDRYFKSANGLSIRFSKLDILIEGNEGVATFTRNDDFTDARSGKEMHLEVRVSSVVSKQGADWKIRGLKKPS